MKYGLSSPEYSGNNAGFYRSANNDTDFHTLTASNFTSLTSGSLSGDFIELTFENKGTDKMYLKLKSSTASDATSTALEVPAENSVRVTPGTIIGSQISYKKTVASDDLQISASFGELV
tara:strand:+ start:267 stop:623 length:357 start_codon:yes stop_codon:yes gene_type:complete